MKRLGYGAMQLSGPGILGPPTGSEDPLIVGERRLRLRSGRLVPARRLGSLTPRSRAMWVIDSSVSMMRPTASALNSGL